ncbi:hypothetical protein [Streptomyces virginiae]|uniref:hypothetical protein n=1 Tax=Streptomyces virginiae TaxID=1961 RepID=UPI002DB88F75|nr:hypothetical protein [Streptomyces sp. CMAA1738]MEC4569609.1 hypothetical protein [Streptomyces sp. CMAA1738]
MSGNAPVDPAEVPVFTGDLAVLDAKVKLISSGGATVSTKASDVHTSFGGLQAFYQAPEADQLFATTKPVSDLGLKLSTDMCTIAGALGTYSRDAAPVIKKLENLKAEAAAFREKTDKDSKWREDGDLIDENLDRRNEIAEVWAEFQEVERAAYAKIVALVGGKPLRVNDGSNAKDMYGYDAEAMKQSKSLPWGDAVEESIPAWQIWEHAWEFGKGIVVDGIWGTLKGLGGLVGLQGWDVFKQSWTGLAKLGTGLAISTIPGVGPLFLAAPDDKLPSWLRDSRTAMKETGKALLAWDQWGSNPSRAAGAVTFNVVTTIFTGGAGGAASGAGKAGAVAKTLSFAGKAGRAIDPMTYIFKGAGAGFSKIGDVMAGLRGMGKVEVPNINLDGAVALPEGAIHLPDGAIHLPSGSAVPDGAIKLPDGNIKLPEGTTTLPPGTVKLPVDGPPKFMDLEGNIYKADGSLDQSGTAARQEPTPEADSGVPRTEAPKTDTPSTARVPERELVGVGARGGDDVIRVGSDISDPLHTLDNGPRGADHTPGGHAGDHTPGGHAPDNMPRNDLNNPGGPRPDSPTPTGATHPDGPGSGATHPDGPGSGATHADGPGGTGGTHPVGPGTNGLPDSPGTGGVDDATRAGDDAPDSGPHQPGDLRYGEGSTEWVQRTPEQAKYWHDEHVRLANENEAWRLQHYEATRGHRLDADRIVDGQRLPKLTEGTSPKWLATDDLPSADREYYRLPPKPVDVSSVRTHVSPKLDELADTHQKYLELGDAQRAYDKAKTPENLATLDAAKDAMGDVPNNTKVGEKLGEGAAKLHVIPAEFTKPKWIELMDTGHGARRFDQLYRLDDGTGDFLIVEAKAPGGELAWRQGAGPHANMKVKQGTIEYVRTILEEMKARGGEDKKIAEQMIPALRRKKVQYVMVQANKHTGTYAGAELNYFDLYRGGR